MGNASQDAAAKLEAEAKAKAEAAAKAEAEAEAKAREEAEARTSKKTVSVYNMKGQFVRAYSLEQHGKGFAAFAKEYAAKIGGTLA